MRGRREPRADLVCLGKWVRRAGLGPEVRSLAAVWCGETAKARIRCSPTGCQHHLTERQLGLRRVGIMVSGLRYWARAATHADAVRQSRAQAAGRTRRRRRIRIRISRACPNGGWSHSTFQETRRRFTKLDSWVVLPTGSQARGAIDATELFGSLPPGLLFACSATTLTCCTHPSHPHLLALALPDSLTVCSLTACLPD